MFMKFNYESIHGKIWWWQGFEHVTNMEGGYSAWVDSGFAGDKPAEELKTFCKFRPWSECFPLRDNSPCGLSCYWLICQNEIPLFFFFYHENEMHLYISWWHNNLLCCSWNSLLYPPHRIFLYREIWLQSSLIYSIGSPF